MHAEGVVQYNIGLRWLDNTDGGRLSPIAVHRKLLLKRLVSNKTVAFVLFSRHVNDINATI